MYANKNNLKSELTANVGSSDTTIDITSGEGVLRETDTVACLEHYEDDVCTKREVVKITAISDDTLTITRGFAVCVMNDETKSQGNTAQTFSTGDFLNLYLSKELRESITTGISTNATNIDTMVARITAPKNCIEGCCQDWKNAIDCAYTTKFSGVAGFGTGADGDCVIETDTFLNAGCEYNFNNLTICPNATVRFCGIGVPTINVRNDFRNCGTIDMRAPYLQARTTCQTDCRLSQGCTICNQCDTLTGIASEGGLYCGGLGGCGACDGCGASDGHGGDGGENPGSYSGNNGGNGITSGYNGTGGGGAYGIGIGGNGGDGGHCGGDGGNGFVGGNGGNKTGGYDGGGGKGGIGVVRGGNAGGGVGASDYTQMGNGGDAITNVYGLHLNARNIYNNCVNARGGDGGNGGEYLRYGSGGYAPSGGCGGNGANGGQMIISYSSMCEQGCFDVRGGCGGLGGRIKFNGGSSRCYIQPDGSNGTDGRAVFKSIANPYISDLSITSDDVNEAILISRRDPGLTSRNKTIVRYSTVDYPATITDGTLAIEETTKNQYSLSPYSLTGLSSNTTYYFTVFALDGSFNVLDTETGTITPERGRTPGANTLAYYPLTSISTISDMSGNNYTLTNSGNTAFGTYTTENVDCAYLNFSTRDALKNEILGSYIGRTDPFTYSLRFNASLVNNKERGIIAVHNPSSWAEDRALTIVSDNTIRFYVHDSDDNKFAYTSTISANTWYYLVGTCDGTNIKVYLNGVLAQTTASGYSSEVETVFSIGSKHQSQTNAFNGYVSNVIVEKIARSQQDITKYFNQTKSQYGIS